MKIIRTVVTKGLIEHGMENAERSLPLTEKQKPRKCNGDEKG